MKSRLSKITNNSLFNVAILCLFVLCAGIYNYGLHRSFWFDYEYCLNVYKLFLKESCGLSSVDFSIYNILGYIPYKMFGCSLKALRVYAMTVYQLIIFLSTIVAIYSFKRKHFEWYKLGIFAFIAVILHPGSSQILGHFDALFHQYPYDMHASATIFAMFSIFLLFIHQGISKQKYKNIIKILICLTIFIGYKNSDFLYILGFVGPLVCVGLIYLWKEKRKIFFAILLGGIAVLALLRIASFAIPSLTPLFVHTYAYYGQWVDSDVIYGNNGFADIRKIYINISTTITALLAMFNIDISGKSMMSISTIIIGIRLLLLAFMFGCCFRTIFNAIIKKYNYKSLDIINIVLALGIIFDFFIIMFSAYGIEIENTRYMPIIVFYGAILLARQSENIIAKLSGETNDISKKYFSLFFFLMIIVNMATFWKEDDYVADYEPAMKNVSSFIIENNLGNGIGGYGYSTTLTIIGGGKYAVVDGSITGDGLQYNYDDEMTAVFNYIIDWESSWGAYDPNDIYKYLGKPDDEYEIDGFVIYYYKDGISRVNDGKAVG